MHTTNPAKYLAPVIRMAVEAGALLMGVRAGGFVVENKADKSPVTEADLAASRFIAEKLFALDAAIPIVTEEDEASHQPPGTGLFWLIDPLDGTRAFVAGETEFTVNIALVENGAPVLGVVGVPAKDTLYYAAKGEGAFRINGQAAPEKIAVRKPGEKLVVVRSKSHPSAKTQAFLDALPPHILLPSSSSEKFCLVAEGSADLYPRFGRTMEWDTAAGHVILNEAGGRVETAEGAPLTYGKPGFENPHFVASGYLFPLSP